MFSATAASKRFARLQRDQEILLWQYATSRTEGEKQKTGLRLMGLKLRQSLMGAFYGAVLAVDRTNDDDWDSADLRRLRDAIIHARALGPAEAVKRALLMRACMEKWAEAKKQNDFTVVSGSLQELVDSIKKEARYKAAAMGRDSPYEALVGIKTPGFSMKNFETWAGLLEGFVRQSLNVLPKGEPPSPLWMMKKTDQQWLQNNFLRRIGYDFRRGAVKESPHPICFGTHDYVPIGMRYNELDFGDLLRVVAHEGGHARYRQSVPAEHKDRLVGGIAGTAMDEAMALLIENHVGRSRPMSYFMADFIRVTMPEHDDPGLTGQSLFQHLNRISDLPIRTRADEVRYRIEKALIDGDMKVSEIPAYWAEEYEKLTGMKIESDNEGPLQDIHWFGGEFGWFPNYLIGQLAAAQLFETLMEDHPEAVRRMQKGDVRLITGWLQEKIYSHGARYTSFELVEKATGRTLDTTAWMKHIVGRYLRPLAVPERRLLPPPGPR